MCQSFNCTPEEALELDPRLVFPIMEYRLLESAKEAINTEGGKPSEAQTRFMEEVVTAMKDGDINA